MMGRHLLRTRDALIDALACVLLSPYSLILGITLALIALHQFADPWEPP